MSVCSLREGKSSLTLSSTPDGSRDYLVSVEAAVNGFSGHADGHVAGRDWETFMADLERLEQARQGKACLASAAEGDFELTVHSIDSQGHMGVSGLLRYREAGVEDWPQQHLRFAFEFDPTKLAAFLHGLARVTRAG